LLTEIIPLIAPPASFTNRSGPPVFRQVEAAFFQAMLTISNNNTSLAEKTILRLSNLGAQV